MNGSCKVKCVRLISPAFSLGWRSFKAVANPRTMKLQTVSKYRNKMKPTIRVADAFHLAKPSVPIGSRFC